MGSAERLMEKVTLYYRHAWSDRAFASREVLKPYQEVFHGFGRSPNFTRFPHPALCIRALHFLRGSASAQDDAPFIKARSSTHFFSFFLMLSPGRLHRPAKSPLAWNAWGVD